MRYENALRTAEGYLDTSVRHTDGDDARDHEIATHRALQGIGYALLALAPMLTEISDHLDRLPRVLRCDEVDRLGQRCVRSAGHSGNHSAGWTP